MHVMCIAGYLNNLKVLYSGSRSGASTQKSGVTRHIPQAPDRILDAPELLDDFCEYCSSYIVALNLFPNFKWELEQYSN